MMQGFNQPTNQPPNQPTSQAEYCAESVVNLQNKNKCDRVDDDVDGVRLVLFKQEQHAACGQH